MTIFVLIIAFGFIIINVATADENKSKNSEEKEIGYLIKRCSFNPGGYRDPTSFIFLDKNNVVHSFGYGEFPAELILL